MPRPSQVELCGDHEVVEVAGMAGRDRRDLTAVEELLRGVLTQRLQHPVASRRAGVDDDHGAFDQAGDCVEHEALRGTGVIEDGFGGIHRPPALEHRKPIEQPLLVAAQEGVAPVHGGPERLLSCFGGPRARCEEREPVVQPIRDLGGRHGARTRRGQLDGERHAVQGAGDPADGNDVGLVEDGSRSSRAGTLHEQLGGRIVEDLIRGRVFGWSRQRPDVDLDLVGDGERFAAGGQDRDVGAAAQDVVGQSRGRIDDVFAVVEEEQQPPVGEVAVDPLADVTLGGGTVHRHAERVRDRDRNLISRVHRRQPHPEDTIREVRQRLDGEREREGRLAGATRPDEGQQPDAGQESPERLEQLLAPDERPHDGRQVRGHRGARTPTVPRRTVGNGLRRCASGQMLGRALARPSRPAHRATRPGAAPVPAATAG